LLILNQSSIKVENTKRRNPVMAAASRVKPLLKWVGGKTQIIHEVIGLFPAEINSYHEPFVGGGSVLLAMLSSTNIRVSEKIYASDINNDLIQFYTNVQSSPDAVISELISIANEYNACPEKAGPGDEPINRKPSTIQEARLARESYYYWIRSGFNCLSEEQRATPAASAMLLFMNKTCFRGVYREGPNGFNVPFGHYKQPFTIDEVHIRAVSQLIQPVIFTCCSFQTAITLTASAGDFVYIDPPYAAENKTSFVSYNYSGFGIECHKELFHTCSQFTAKHIKFLMSNADVEMVTSMFPSPAYSTKKINCKRAIHSKDPGTRTTEVLITNC